MQEIRKQVDREISNTSRWAIGLMLTIVLQSATIVWWASQLNAKVEENAGDIAELKNGALLLISRDQLNDILRVRDTRLDTLTQSMQRIEQKLDRNLPY